MDPLNKLARTIIVKISDENGLKTELFVDRLNSNYPHAITIKTNNEVVTVLVFDPEEWQEFKNAVNHI